MTWCTSTQPPDRVWVPRKRPSRSTRVIAPPGWSSAHFVHRPCVRNATPTGLTTRDHPPCRHCAGDVGTEGLGYAPAGVARSGTASSTRNAVTANPADDRRMEHPDLGVD